MSTLYTVNYIKSIKKQRLVYNINSRLIFSYIICCFCAFAVYIMLLSILGDLFVIKPVILYSPILFLLLAFIFFVWTITNLILLNKLLKIDGKGKEVNRNDMIKILNDNFKLTNLDISDENILRDVKPYRFILNGRIITCLLDNEVIYLNLISLQNYNFISSFNGLTNYYKCKRIAKHFTQLQATIPLS